MKNSNLLINLLYQMAFADGKFTENEKNFISQVIEEQVSDPDTLIDGKVEIPTDEKERMTILYYLLFLLRIDNIIRDSEKEIAHKFGLMLGFRSEMISSMIHIMEQHLDERLPDEKLIRVVRQYLN